MFSFRLALLCYLLSLSACTADVVQECLEAEKQGVFLFDRQDTCGCHHLTCPADSLCYHHECQPREFCQAGICCNPAKQPDCQCNPLLHAVDMENCGCQGICPTSSYCVNGACVCNSPLLAICDPTSEKPWGECKEPNDCLCVREYHSDDATNCGCRGRCADDQLCSAGKCQCDPLNHQSDNTNCGCTGPCNSIAGLKCIGGQCRCDPLEHQTDNVNCGCGGVCNPTGSKECIGGQCRCDPLKHQTDNSNCGCGGVCDPTGGKECIGGSCRCDPLKHQLDNSNCGCAGSCSVGNTCVGGVCLCDPEQHLGDKNNCYCAGACSSMTPSCIDGYCV